jgi:hypothetical protein
MGQAKQRGTFEQRKAGASGHGRQIADLVNSGTTPHYAFIFDKSPEGRNLMDRLRCGPAEIKARINHPAVELWESMDFEFMVIWGTFGYSGGLTVPTKDSEVLLAEALPRVVQRTIEKGGLCAFIVGVSKSLAETVQSRLAELQATTGNSSTGDAARDSAAPVVQDSGASSGNPHTNETDAPKQPHKGLLTLATEPVGRELDFDMVQITDPQEFAKVTGLGMDDLYSALEQVKQGKMGMEELEGITGDSDRLRAWAREDGTLLVRETTTHPREVVIAAGKWRELSAAELAALSQQLVASNLADPAFPGVLTRLVEETDLQLEMRTRRSEAMAKISELATSMTAVYSREPQSLLALRGAFEQDQSCVDAADRWLNSGHRYFVIWRSKTGEQSAILAPDEEALINEALPSALAFGEDPSKSLFASCTMTEIDHTAERWWSAHGGLVRPDLRKHH